MCSGYWNAACISVPTCHTNCQNLIWSPLMFSSIKVFMQFGLTVRSSLRCLSTRPRLTGSAAALYRHQLNTQLRRSGSGNPQGRSTNRFAVQRGLSARLCAAMAASTCGLETAGSIEVQRIPALSDNYVWLLQDKKSGKVAVVDPSEAEPVVKALKERGLHVDFILNTHHHFDHTGGNEALKKQFNCTIVGPKADEGRIPGIDVALKDGDTWDFGKQTMHVFDTPGHTRGHITLWFPEADALFPGDTLFALGCGRLFEGSPAQMWGSLSKMIPLSPSAKVFCAHEYTQSNAKWAVTVDPNNEKLQQRKQQIDSLRSKGEPTIPSTLQEELDTNPFLRPSDPNIRHNLGVSPDAPDVEAWAAIRKHKDNF